MEGRGTADLEDFGLAPEGAAATLDDDGFDLRPRAPSAGAAGSADDAEASAAGGGGASSAEEG